jgi:hypothetical protein
MFNPNEQRIFIGPDGPVTIDIPLAVKLIKLMEPTDAEMDRGVPFEFRNQRAQELAREGHVIDVPIDVWGWDGYKTMKLRKMYGYRTVPDALGQIQIVVA